MESNIENLKIRYNLPDTLISKVKSAYEIMKDSYSKGKKVMVCGNGGSAADSEHIVGELMKSFVKKRNLDDDFLSRSKELGFEDLKDKLQGTLEAISLVSQVGVISAFANDIDADYVYAQQVYGYGKSDDVLIALSTSGNSKNIVNAVKVAKAKNMKVISITNVNGGKLKELSDVNINIDETETYKVQEKTLPIYHALCLDLEEYFFK